MDALSDLRDDLKATLAKPTIREVREGLERRFVTSVIDADAEGVIQVTPRMKRAAIYAAWGQPADAEEIPAEPIAVGPADNGRDSWESLNNAPDA